MASKFSKEQIQCTVRARATDRGPVKVYHFHPDGHKDSQELTQAQAEVEYPRAQYRWSIVDASQLSAPRDVIPF